MIQIWSFESAATPIVAPMTQWLGSGFGHMGSTSKRGACTPAASTTALFRSTEDPSASAPISVIKAVPIQYVRFMFFLVRSAYAIIHDSVQREQGVVLLLSSVSQSGRTVSRAGRRSGS